MATATDHILPQLADALTKKGHYNEALLRFEQALASDRSNAELWFGLAQTWLVLGQESKGAANLYRALDVGLTQPTRALKLLASMFQESLEPARAALERYPNDIALLALNIEFELAHGNGTRACSVAQRLFELTPERVDLIIPVIQKLIDDDWHAEARTLIEPLAHNNPEDPEIVLLVDTLSASS